MEDRGIKARTHEVVDSGPATVGVDGPDVVCISVLAIIAHGGTRDATYEGVERHC